VGIVPAQMGIVYVPDDWTAFYINDKKEMSGVRITPRLQDMHTFKVYHLINCGMPRFILSAPSWVID